MEHNFYTDKLLELLIEDHPDFIIQHSKIDFEKFIEQRADEAATTCDILLKQGIHADIADETAMETLYSGFKFSKFATVKDIFLENYKDIASSFENDQKRNYFILDLTLKCYPVFEKYGCSDVFAYNDLLDYEILGKIALIIEAIPLEIILSN